MRSGFRWWEAGEAGSSPCPGSRDVKAALTLFPKGCEAGADFLAYLNLDMRDEPLDSARILQIRRMLERTSA